MVKSITIISLFIIFTGACKKDNEFNYALIQTGEVTNIDITGAVFNAKISDLSTSDIIEYGFVWDTTTNVDLQVSEKTIIQGSPTIGVVNARISTTLKKGLTYYVRAFIRNNDYITYGKVVKFQSLGSSAPKILDFYPKKGNVNDTLFILGKNFSYVKKSNSVYFGNYKAPIIKAGQDTLVVSVPKELNNLSSQIKVSIWDNDVYSTDNFYLELPVFDGFEAKKGTWGTQISISGSNFMSNASSLHVYFDTFRAKITNLQNNSITAIVPDSLNKQQCHLFIEMNNLKVTSSESFALTSNVLTDFYPQTVLTGQAIKLQGDNFSPIPRNNTVTIGGLTATVIKASTTELEIAVPKQDMGIYPDRNARIEVTVLGENHGYDKTVTINDRWFRRSNAPNSLYNPQNGYDYKHVQCFTYNNKAYIGLNNNSIFMEYDPTKDEWTQKSDFPGEPRQHGVGFLIDGKVFFGTGAGERSYNDLKDWWEYNISTNTWNQKKDFLGERRTGAIGFQFNKIGYVGAGLKLYPMTSFDHGYTDFWKYSPNDDTWKKATSYPMFDYFGMWWGIAITNSTAAYIGLGNVTISGSYERWMYRYYPNSNTWLRIEDYPYADVNNYSVGFEIAGKIYIKTTYTDHFYCYDEIMNSWEKVQTDILSNIDSGIAFTIGSKAYIGLGGSSQMWEYDPYRQ